MSEPVSPSVSLLCPSCSEPITATAQTASCDACRATIEVRPDSTFPASTPLQACALCSSEALYIAKDFNKNFGVAIVLLACIGFYWGALAGIATLVVLTALDRLVYYLRPLVTVCYACKAVYRDVEFNPAHKPYELTFDETFEGTGEVVRFTTATPVPPRAGHDGPPGV